MISITAALSLLALVAPAEPESDFKPPVRLTVDGQPIDLASSVGHAGPNLFDVDGDGAHELVVGAFSGHLHVHEITPSDAGPIFGPGKKLQAEGADIRISNW